jgi:hypothetical protein
MGVIQYVLFANDNSLFNFIIMDIAREDIKNTGCLIHELSAK